MSEKVKVVRTHDVFEVLRSQNIGRLYILDDEYLELSKEDYEAVRAVLQQSQAKVKLPMSYRHKQVGRLAGTAHMTFKAQGTLTARAVANEVCQPPPKSADYLLYLFLSREDRVGMFGDFEEEYRTELLPKYGVRGAQFWYWCRVFHSIAPVICGAAGRLLWWFKQ